jgi:methylenetetrahydrofolate reductase (NADPH)
MTLIVENDTASVPAHADVGESIARFVLGASIETSTKNLAEIDSYGSLLPAATDIYVPCLPGTPYHHILSVAKRLRQVGMNPVPHIAARRLVNATVASVFLAGLRDEAGVTRALVIAGDSQAAVGPYTSSLAILETGLLQAHGIRSVGIAGYPEGHGGISAQALLEALDRKIAYARSHGIEPFVVSQFCFDGNVVVDWLAKLRARGVTLPVRVGLAGPAKVRTLLNYGMRCGVGDSLRAFGSQPVSLTRLLMRHGPEKAVRTIAQSAAELGIAGLHFFPFGGFAESARWIKKVSTGRFRLTGSDEGFALEGDTRTSA